MCRALGPWSIATHAAPLRHPRTLPTNNSSQRRTLLTDLAPQQQRNPHHACMRWGLLCFGLYIGVKCVQESYWFQVVPMNTTGWPPSAWHASTRPFMCAAPPPPTHP